MGAKGGENQGVIMAIHDWTRVEDGVFHSFHNAWVAELVRVLNAGLLPPECYALGD